MINSKIEWTDATWNPVRGCTKVSPGCAHCYAETLMERFRGVPGHPFEHGFDLRLVPEKLEDPLRWTKPRRIFVNSLSDLFHHGIRDEYIEQVCDAMLKADWHIYQVLTKRADRMASLLHDRLRESAKAPHIWWGVSVEERFYAITRIAALTAANPANAFVSAEPLLEDIGKLDLSGIGWVIVGGESGHRARPMHPQWARNIRDQCVAAGVPFFFKQWGEWGICTDQDVRRNSSLGRSMAKGGDLRWMGILGYTCPPNAHPANDCYAMARVGKRAAGRLLDGREHNELPGVSQ